jgi:hypothetical protein
VLLVLARLSSLFRLLVEQVVDLRPVLLKLAVPVVFQQGFPVQAAERQRVSLAR